MTTGQISRDEMHGALEDKLCSYFGVTGKEATDEQVFQASAMVIREIMSRLLAAEKAETRQTGALPLDGIPHGSQSDEERL